MGICIHYKVFPFFKTILYILKKINFLKIYGCYKIHLKNSEYINLLNYPIVYFIII